MSNSLNVQITDSALRPELSTPLNADAKSSKLLIVDDDPVLVEVLSESLRAHGFGCACAPDASSARRIIVTYRFEALLIGFLPRFRTAGVVQAFVVEHPNAPVILLTGDALMEVQDIATTNGVLLVLKKPITSPELAAELSELLSGGVESSRKKTG